MCTICNKKDCLGCKNKYSGYNIELSLNLEPELKKEMDKAEKRRNYTSLDEFVKEEGIETVLEWLSRSPTEISTETGRYYRHSKMKSVNYTVKKFQY